MTCWNKSYSFVDVVFCNPSKFCTWRISDKWECYSHFITCHISNETRTISVFANGMTNNQFEFISLVFTLINILYVYLPINVIWTFDKYQINISWKRLSFTKNKATSFYTVSIFINFALNWKQWNLKREEKGKPSCLLFLLYSEDAL